MIIIWGLSGGLSNSKTIFKPFFSNAVIGGMPKKGEKMEH